MNTDNLDITTDSDNAIELKENPEITVIIPIYNVENYLEETLDSAINQTFRNIEILCIDDGSTDSSADILSKYAAKDNRIRIHCKKNEGVGKARNVGIDLAKGKYIYFLDSDDLIDSRTLEICYESAEKDELDIVLFEGDAFYESAELEELFPKFKTLYHRRNEYPDISLGRDLYILLSENWDGFTHICMKLYRKAYIREHSVYFPENIYYEDEIFNIKSMLYANKAKVLTERLYKRRVRNNSIMTHADGIYKRYASYHECACLLLDYISDADLNFETVRCLVFRVATFLDSADRFYQQLDEGNKKKAENDASIRPLNYALLKSLLDFNRNSFFRNARDREHVKEELKVLHNQIKNLDEERKCQSKELSELYKKTDEQKEELKGLRKEKAEHCEEIQKLNKEKVAQHQEIQGLYKNNAEQKNEISALKKELDEQKAEIKALIEKKKKQEAKIADLKDNIKEKKAQNNKLKESNKKYKARLKAIDEGAIVVRMDKRVVRFLKSMKRKIKRILG